MMKKWSLTLKVFLIVFAIGFLYVLIASIVRVCVGQIEIGMAVQRFIIGNIIGASVAGIAAGITALVVAIKNKKKLSLPLMVFLIAAAVAILYVLIRTIIRVSSGEISTGMAVVRFIIGSIIYVLGAGVIAGITALVLAIKKLGE
jgi:RsiW-degrading membrane proteinase PrsW (M82 family)